MANMSYCRFQNTLKDLVDCQDAIEAGETIDLSPEERSAMNQLVIVCREIANGHDYSEDEDGRYSE